MKIKGIGKRLRELRGKTTQIEWAKKLSVTQIHVSRTENEKSGISLKYLSKISLLTNHTIHWMMTGEEPRLISEQRKDIVQKVDEKSGTSKMVPRTYLGEAEPVWLDSLKFLIDMHIKKQLTDDEFEKAKKKLLE